MGTSVWFFQRTRPGELTTLTLRTAEAFFSGDGRLPPDADGFVRYAQVIVNVENRRAVQVLRVGFFQCLARPDGTLDPKHRNEMVLWTAESLAGSLHDADSTPGVIRASHLFARRRLEHSSQWMPTPDEMAQLRGLVNRKAGRDLL